MIKKTADHIIYEYSVKCPYTGKVEIKKVEWRLVPWYGAGKVWEKVS